MLQFAVILAFGYIAYLLWEKWCNDRHLSHFRYIIHVNGIRGKTGVCRLLDAALRGAGYRVFTKTTGTTPVYIDTAGAEHVIRRRGGANIREQLAMIRLAHREGAEILILECMAVDPALQRAAQAQIVKGNLNVITNVRYDHTFAMGESLDEIAASLAATIPSAGMLFTADVEYFDYFGARCREKGSQAVLCRPNEIAHNENLAVAHGVASHLGIGEQDFLTYIGGYRADFGADKRYTVGGIPFLNLFSVNDPQSTRLLVEQYLQDSSQATFLYNNRADRPDRLLLFARHFFSQVPCKGVIVVGEHRRLAQRILRKSGLVNVETEADVNAVFRRRDTGVIVGIGNIKGDVCDLIHDLEVDNHE